MNADLRITQSRFAFDETIRMLTRSIEQSGARLFAAIDQREAAAGVNLDLRPTTLLLFGNPKGGTPLMAGWPAAAIELPLRLLVWEENGSVSVARWQMSERLAALGVPATEPHVIAMDSGLEALVAVVGA